MTEIPLIELRLNNFREQIVHAVMLRDAEITDMINTAVNQSLNKTNFQELVNAAVDKAINKSIEQLATDWEVQSVIRRIVSDALRKFENS